MYWVAITQEGQAMTTLLEATKSCCTITQTGRGQNPAYKIEFGHFEARAATQGEALTRLLKKIEKATEGEYRPIMIAFRSEYVIIYRSPTEDWAYMGPMAQGHELKHASTSGLKTRDEAERQARFALAQKVWDGNETTSPIITNEQDQKEFQSTAILAMANKLPHVIEEQIFWEHWNIARGSCTRGSVEESAMMRAFYLREYSRCQPNGVAATMLEDAVFFEETNSTLAQAYRRYVNDLYEWAGIEGQYEHFPELESIKKR